MRLVGQEMRQITRGAMAGPMLDWVCAYLEQDEDVVVPVKKMWNEWQARHGEPSLTDFTRLVLADERIEALGAVDPAEGLAGWSPNEVAEYERDMEDKGYFSGPRVKLKSRELTLEIIVRMITRHSDRMEEALRQVQEALPADAGLPEAKLLGEVIERARQLRRSLRQAGLDAGGGDWGE